MEPSTTIRRIFAGNRIFVPSYQRAYSWDTEFDVSKTPKQVNVFFSDLDDYMHSSAKSKYYFGHFLFEEITDNRFEVIDGQQRLTTIVIFLSALFNRLKLIRRLKEAEQEIYEDIIRRNSTYRFASVYYDNQLFKDYAIDQLKKDKNGLETVSAKRIINAYDFLSQKLIDKDEHYLVQMIEAIQGSSCTTHPVKDESEAIQMFIFQNNRGKKPSNLEIIKAQFMFNVHLYGGEEKDPLIDEIKTRFEKIYKSISSIEYNIDEDDILVYTLRVHFNSLSESNAIAKINKLLSEGNTISFIKSFSYSLSESFEKLTTFFGDDEKKNFNVHSLISLRGIGIAIPFIIKAYKFGIPTNQFSQLCSSLESLVIRHRLIGTRADIIPRINDVFQKFGADNSDITPIIEKIEMIKNVSSDSWWWGYWNNKELKRALHGRIDHNIAKFLLWKYENYLGYNEEKSGYSLKRIDFIQNPELEHIAPKTENPETGYDPYDEEFINQYINCLGNYVLISKEHNCSIGNKPFVEKRASYIYIKQQQEIQDMTNNNVIWTKSLIQERKDKIIKFLMDNI